MPHSLPVYLKKINFQKIFLKLTIFQSPTITINIHFYFTTFRIIFNPIYSIDFKINSTILIISQRKRFWYIFYIKKLNFVYNPINNTVRMNFNDQMNVCLRKEKNYCCTNVWKEKFCCLIQKNVNKNINSSNTIVKLDCVRIIGSWTLIERKFWNFDVSGCNWLFFALKRGDFKIFA